jgi:outer membrane protein TolC
MPELANQTPELNFYQFSELPPLENLLSQAKNNSRTIKIFNSQSVQFERRLKSLKDSIRPELNLDLRTAVKSEDQQGLAVGVKDSDDGQDYSVGLTFKKMLGNKSAKGESEKVNIQLNQLELEKQFAQMELASNIQNIYIQLKEMRNILELNKELVNTAQETTKEEIKTYQQGRSDLTNVISSRDQTQNARLLYAQNAINYHQLYLQLQALTDRLLVVE